MRLTQSSINQGLLRSEDTAAFALDKSMTVTETNILADSIERLVYSRGAMHEAYLTRQDTPKTAGADDFNTPAFDKDLYKFP